MYVGAFVCICDQVAPIRRHSCFYIDMYVYVSRSQLHWWLEWVRADDPNAYFLYEF